MTDPAPKRIRLSRAKGWRMPPNTVKVDRSTKWGNPCVVVRDEMRWDGETETDDGEPVLHGPWLCKMQPDRLSGWWFSTKAKAVAKSVEFFRWRMTEPFVQSPIKEQLHELRGKNLGCWCALCPEHADGKPFGIACPNCEPCHSDVLGELANPEPVR